MKIDSAPLLEAGKHCMSLSEIESLAVEPFVGSGTRTTLFKDLQHLVGMLESQEVSCEIWVDGSFLTEKLNPNDIDLTLVISSQSFETITENIKHEIVMLCDKTHRLSASLDCYISDSQDQTRLSYWHGMWGSGRDNKPKGYIILEIEASRG